VLAGGERQHRCAKASLRRVAATWKARIGLAKCASGVCVTPFIHRQVGKKNQRCASERVTRVATNELAQHRASTAGLAGAKKRTRSLVRGGRSQW
jgi:hypothetical protein